MKSLHKALDILETFLEVGSGEIRLSEIAKITGIHKATVNRIASVFVARGYLNQLERRGKYSIAVNDRLWDQECDAVWDPVFSPEGDRVLLKTLQQGRYVRRVVSVADILP